MKLRFFAIFALILCLWPAHAEVLKSFHADITLNRDTSLDVWEIIEFDPEGAQRHGIKRTIPVVYDRDGGKYTVYLHVLSVTDNAEKPQTHVESRIGRDLEIKIGDADQFLSGPQTYKIHYLARRAINFFGGQPELYWNVTGNDSPFTTRIASARLHAPVGVRTDQIQTITYVGPPGSKTPGTTQVNAQDILFFSPELPPGQGLTFAAKFPAGSVVPPSFLQNFLWLFADWWPAIVFPLCAVALMVSLWQATGRDIEGDLPAQVEWAPPKDLTPAEVGTLIDERCDMQDIVSTLIDLAARGYLKIEEIQTDKILFFQSRDYRFTKLDRPHDPTEASLRPHEAEFLAGIFGSTFSGNSTTLSSLKNEFYVHLPRIKSAIYQGLMDKRLFTANPETTRTAYFSVGALVGAAGVFACIFLPQWGLVAYGIGLALTGVIICAMAGAMPAKTATGSRKLRECVGFQRFVKLAEKDRIEKLITDDPTIFGRLLPYAMVLGVGDEWAGKFADLMKEPPDWYSTYDHRPFFPRMFVNDLGGGMNQMGQTFASKPQPQSTGGSGGSGFSSGGGSGGGFGGGGTSSW